MGWAVSHFVEAPMSRRHAISTVREVVKNGGTYDELYLDIRMFIANAEIFGAMSHTPLRDFLERLQGRGGAAPRFPPGGARNEERRPRRR